MQINSHEISQNSLRNTAPFLRWAGGKRWLTSKYNDLFPKSFNCYFEPFLGGASVFFHLQPKLASLSDINSDLICTYNAIKDDWMKVEELLFIHSKNHSSVYYYEMRSFQPIDNFEIAARFIYLNRTCWNGLYRVNSKGKFNVPIGTIKNVLRPEDSFKFLSESFKNVNFLVKDFELAIDQAQEKDFIFADPPYTVKHNFNGFIGYNENIFHWDDQIRLSDALKRANARGCLIMLTNANHPSVKSLYENDFSIKELSRSSTIAGNAKDRGCYEEIVVTNF